MDEIVNVLLVLVNLGLTAINMKMYSELAKWHILDPTRKR